MWPSSVGGTEIQLARSFVSMIQPTVLAVCITLTCLLHTVWVLGSTLGQELGDSGMAHSEILSDVTLRAIASQVGAFYPSLGADLNIRPAEAQLAETFPLWVLGADDIIAGGDDIGVLAKNTGRWHSQLRSGKGVFAAARSIPLGAGDSDWQLRQILGGRYAQEIDQQVDWIDENAKGDPLVRLLEIPAFQITAFWLLNDDNRSDVVVAVLPANSQFLEKRRVYGSQEFLVAMRKERFVIGIRR